MRPVMYEVADWSSYSRVCDMENGADYQVGETHVGIKVSSN